MNEENEKTEQKLICSDCGINPKTARDWQKLMHAVRCLKVEIKPLPWHANLFQVSPQQKCLVDD